MGEYEGRVAKGVKMIKVDLVDKTTGGEKERTARYERNRERDTRE